MRGSLYDKIAEEIDGGEIDKGLWTEAYAATNGDDRLTRSQYIKLRLRRLRSLGFRGTRFGGDRPDGVGGHRESAAGTVSGWIDAVLIDLWTAWIWGWTFVFAALTAAGVLSLIVKFSLRLFDDGLIAWPFLTAGCAFMTCFLFQRGVHRLLGRPPTMIFHTVEIVALGAAVWLVARVADPSALGRLPRVLIPELVYLVVRFFHSADPVANVLSLAMFFLPVYAVIAFARQKMIS